MNNYNKEERRTFIRVELPVKCSILADNTTISADCLNISATGMCISLSSGKLSIGQMIHVHLEDNDEGVPALNAQAKVVRIIDPKLGQYGIQFLHTS